MNDSELFLLYINNNYNHLKYKYINFCREKGYQWDEDIFSDTILKCYEAINKKGKLEDTTDQGIQNYFFISFKLNLKREGQYSRNAKRDRNIDSDSINELYEDYYNKNNSSSAQKVYKDLFKDFSVLYIMTVVEDNFDQEHFYLFKLKTLGDMTYKQLQDKTKIKASRQKVINVKNWLKDNVTKDDIKKAFGTMYGDLLPE
jgi:hypothetical protein